MSAEPLALQSIHHVELLVGNAKQAAYYYRKAFGFSQIAYAGPETGVREQASDSIAADVGGAGGTGGTGAGGKEAARA